MISRRNIRVKVMQTLYSVASLENGVNGFRNIAAKMLDDKLEHVIETFTISVLYTLRVSQFVETDAAKRSIKYLPTTEDLNVDIQIAANAFVMSIVGNKSFQDKIEKSKLERFIDDEWVKKIYKNFIKTDEYINYISTKNHNISEERDIIRFIWEKQILANEDMVANFNDEISGWEDDCELITMLMQNFFNSKSKPDFLKLLSAEKLEYAQDLLSAVLGKDSLCLEIIEPKLNNWDKERVANIDMLLLKMGVCEFLFFPTIPTKVTINEYIDIAKQYSTPQSGQFINGVLDNILKDLVKEDKIHKQDRTNKL